MDRADEGTKEETVHKENILDKCSLIHFFSFFWPDLRLDKASL